MTKTTRTPDVFRFDCMPYSGLTRVPVTVDGHYALPGGLLTPNLSKARQFAKACDQIFANDDRWKRGILNQEAPA